MADALAKLRALSEVGVRTIVDLTVIGLGRYIPRIQRVNEQVDICCRAGTTATSTMTSSLPCATLGSLMSRSP